jgi:hypothetical protein
MTLQGRALSKSKQRSFTKTDLSPVYVRLFRLRARVHEGGFFCIDFHTICSCIEYNYFNLIFFHSVRVLFGYNHTRTCIPEAPGYSGTFVSKEGIPNVFL